MNRNVFRGTVVVLLSAVTAAAATAQDPIFKVGYTDIGPVVGLGGIGDAGLSFGARFERAIKALPDLGGGTLGLEASVDIWTYNSPFGTSAYDFRWMAFGGTANYHFAVKSNPKIDPFLGAGLGFNTVSTDAGGDYSSGISFIGRAGIRYFLSRRMALYADAGAGASAINAGLTFSLGGGQ